MKSLAQSPQNRRPTVIVAGAQGVSGNAVLRQYVELVGAKVYGLSRRSVEDSGNVRHIAVDLLARAVIWAGEAASARNELFNVTNGDTFRWQHMWPRIAKMLGLEIADPVPFSLTTYMADKASVWDAIVKREKLQRLPYKEVVSWGFGDFVFGQGFDNVSSTIKIRQAGFAECLDSEAMFAGLFERLRKLRIVPSTMCGS